jgi:hypothetical protein
LLPSSGVINPKPLASLNHLTVPLSLVIFEYVAVAVVWGARRRKRERAGRLGADPGELCDARFR